MRLISFIFIPLLFFFSYGRHEFFLKKLEILDLVVMTAGLIVNIVVISLHNNKTEENCNSDVHTGEFVKYENSLN
jgi:hypothetical protein